ncbi:MAG TPA: ABC transporter ATP-binding protein [Acidimicrobiales bacterium]
MLLSVEGLAVNYGAVRAVTDLHLEVPERSVVALLGANGAGKTTSLRAISGLLPPAAGRVVFDGTDITGAPPHRIARAGLVQVPQGRRVFAPLTVEENLLLGGYARPNRELAGGLEEVYAMFPILRERRKAEAGVLSGGEQQMLAFGRALMANPRLIAMDEPSMGLAPLVVDQVFEAITAIAERGTAVLLVEQNVVASLEIADHAHVLHLGAVRRSGTPAELAGDDVLDDLLGVVAAPGTASTSAPTTAPTPTDGPTVPAASVTSDPTTTTPTTSEERR